MDFSFRKLYTDRAGSYFYKLFNFAGINMEVTNAVTNIE